MREVNFWWSNARGCWDHGLMLAMLNGDLWPMPNVRWREFQGEPPPTDQGAVVVASGIMLDRNKEECAKIKEIVAKLPWCILIHTGDESWEFDTHCFERPGLRIWMEHPMPGTPQWGHRQLLLGWPWQCRQQLREMTLKPLAERRLDWCYAGHAFSHAGRSQLAQILLKQSGGEVHVSGGFAQGLPQADYIRLLADSRIIPCPSGHFTPESFRLYEALEAGCLPVTDREPPPSRPHIKSFWTDLLGDVPWPMVGNWAELPDLLAKYKADPIALQRDANKAGAWWARYKRQVALDMLADIAELSGVPL